MDSFSVDMIKRHVSFPLDAATKEAVKKGGLWTRVGLVPVALLRGIVELPIIAMAATIETLVLLVLNLVGALFNEQCQKDLITCIGGVLVYPCFLAISPFLGILDKIFMLVDGPPVSA